MTNTEKTPVRRPSNSYTTVKRESEEIRKTLRRASDQTEPDSTPKSSRRPSKEDHKTILSTTSRLRSTETIKKAKALFENINKEQDRELSRQKDILSRPSVFEGIYKRYF